MTAERWDRVKAVFQDAADLGPDLRPGFLERACAGDTLLRDEVERLLRGHADDPEAASMLAVDFAQPLLSLQPGTLLAGRFRITRLAGHGGMGQVYEARDEELGGRVALKIIHPEIALDAKFMARFRREVQVARKVTHPNVCRIFDAGRDEASGRSFCTMEFIDGETLAQLLQRRGRMEVEEALPLVQQLAEGLSALHEQSIVHRDFKPGNVMLAARADGETRAVITDFGLARGASEDSPVTRTGVVTGTPDYMSPEQLLGKPSTPASDVYALGVVMYEMVTGQRPFRGGQALENAVQRVVEPAVEPRRLVKELPETWNRAILACLEREPEHRPPTPAAVAAALVSAKPLPSRLSSRRRRMAAAVAAGVALAAGVAAWQRPWVPSLPAPAASVSSITAFPGSKDFPALSPDGRQISFVWTGAGYTGSSYHVSHPRSLYVQRVEGGEPRALTNGESHELLSAWSPDGMQIAFLRREPLGIFVYVIPAAGGPEKRICEAGVGLSWSPNGGELALASPPDAMNRNHILVYSLATGQQRRLTNPQPASDSFPTFSPDGKTIAFIRHFTVSAREVMTVPAGGGPATRLTFDQRATWGVAWSPSGTDLLFSANRGGGEILWRIPAKGGKPSPLGLTPHNAFHPAVASRAGRLVYTEAFMDSNLYLKRVGDEEPRVVVRSTREDHSPDFSPDGTRIVFASKRTGSDEIWVADRDGGHATQLTRFDGPATGSPRWSPDGQTVAFDTRAGGRAGIYLISAAGGGARRFSPAENDERVPFWSHDGAWIYFSRPSGKTTNIYKRHLQSGAEVQVTRQGAEIAVEAPGGNLVYYAKGGEVTGIWAVPSNGGAEAPIKELANAGYWRYWGVTKLGLFFVPRVEGARPVMQLFDPVTRRVRALAPLDKELAWNAAGAAMSADGQWLVYSQVDQTVNDILMIDHLR